MADYFVLYGIDSNITASLRSSPVESFESYAGAEKRAIELAQIEPGREFLICKTVSKVLCPIGTARVVPVS